MLCLAGHAQNNVGIGTSSPHSSALLDLSSGRQGLLIPRMSSLQRAAIAGPPAHGLLVFDYDIGCVMLYDSTAVSWRSLCASGGGAAIDFSCGDGALTVNGVASAHSAWLLSGSRADTAGYLGSYDDQDIRISTHNGSCTYDPLRGKMIIARDGSVGIGYSGTAIPTYPRNKLLVENGPPITGWDVYDDGMIPILGSTANVGLLAVGNSTNSANVSIVSLIRKAGAPAAIIDNIAVMALMEGNYANNHGYALSIGGDYSSNVGYSGEVGKDAINSANFNYRANTGIASTNSYNAGYVANVGYRSTGSVNIGISDTVHGDAGPLSVGLLMRVDGTPLAATGILCDMATTGSTDVSGLEVRFSPGADASITNYGVRSDLSAGLPVLHGTTPYYAVYGIAPSGTAAGSGSSSGTNSYCAYAGYFEGDVFSSNNYNYSDPKLKQNIRPYTGALDQLGRIAVSRYVFRGQEFPRMNLPAGEQIGLLATDLKAVFPSLVKSSKHPANGKDDVDVHFEAVNYSGLIPVLVEAVRELNAKVDSQITVKDLTALIALQKELIYSQSDQLRKQQLQMDEFKKELDQLKAKK